MPAFIWIIREANEYRSTNAFSPEYPTHKPQAAVIIRHSPVGENKMIYENQEYEYPTKNMLNILLGMLIGSVAGAVTMLLLAPQSGKDTRSHIQNKGIELRDRTNEMVEDTLAQVRLNPNKVEMSVKNYEQLEHESDVA
jgi:YtxH-like protein